MVFYERDPPLGRSLPTLRPSVIFVRKTSLSLVVNSAKFAITGQHLAFTSEPNRCDLPVNVNSYNGKIERGGK